MFLFYVNSNISFLEGGKGSSSCLFPPRFAVECLALEHLRSIIYGSKISDRLK